MNLLRTLTQPNYPTDYLVARIRGKKGDRIRDWQPLIANPDKSPFASDEEIWGKYSGEIHWLYKQMNQKLRNIFDRIIKYYEIQTLFQCLRFMEGGQKKVALELLSTSLIDEKIQKIVAQETPGENLIRKLLNQMGMTGHAAKRIHAAYNKNGLRSFENLLLSDFLGTTIKERTHPAIRSFFMDIIALRNTLSQAKQVRWQQKNPPEIISIGSRTKKHSSLKYGGTSENSARKNEMQLLETRLLTALTKKFQRLSRTKGDIAVIIAFIWERYIETKNLSTVLHGRTIAPDRLAEELVH